MLLESTDKKGQMYGYTENYIKVHLPYEAEKVGQIVPVLLSRENICMEGEEE